MKYEYTVLLISDNEYTLTVVNDGTLLSPTFSAKVNLLAGEQPLIWGMYAAATENSVFQYVNFIIYI